MKKLILFYFLIFNLAIGQETLKGEYDKSINMYRNYPSDYWVSEFTGEFAKAYNSGYYGVINKNGDVKLPLEFDDILITDSVFYAYKHEDNFVFDLDGKLITQPKYDLFFKRKGKIFKEDSQTYSFFYGSGLNEGIFMVESSCNNGLICKNFYNEFGQPLFKGTKYQRAHLFSQGLAAVWKDEKCGYINKSGKEVIPFEYDYCNFFDNERAIVSIGKQYAMIDKSGKKIIPFSDNANISFSRGGLYPFCKDSKCGYIDKNAKIIIPLKYDKAESFHGGFAKVKLDGSEFQIDMEDNKYSNQQFGYEYGYQIRRLPNNSYVYEDKSGKEIFRTNYYKAYSFHQGLMKIGDGDKEGIIDQLGKVILPPIYDKVKIESGFIMLLENGYWYLADKKGNKKLIISKGSTKNLSPEFSLEGFLHIFNDDNKRGLINAHGKVVLSIEFDNIYVHEYFIQAYKNEKNSFYDYNGKLILPENQYELMSENNKGFIIKDEKKMMVYDIKFKKIFEIDIDVEKFPPAGYLSPKQYSQSSKMIPYLKKGKIGFVDLINLKKIDAVYDNIIYLTISQKILLTKGTDYTIYNPKNQSFTTHPKNGLDIIDEYNSELLIIKNLKTQKSGIINHNFESILPIEHDYILSIGYYNNKNNPAPKTATHHSKRFGNTLFIDKNGKIVK